MNKRSIAVLMTVAMILTMSITVFADQWILGDGGFWYQYDDGSWPADMWVWIDGDYDGIAECYYFDSDGYNVYDTVTPDGYTVGSNGSWTVDGIIQTRESPSSMLKDLSNTNFAIGGDYYIIGNSSHDKTVLYADQLSRAGYYRIEVVDDNTITAAYANTGGTLGNKITYYKIADNTYQTNSKGTYYQSRIQFIDSDTMVTSSVLNADENPAGVIIYVH